MATASTKSRGNKSKGRPPQANVAAAQDNETGGIAAGATTGAGGDGELSARAWRIGCASVMLVAALVRLYQLELRPMHHDEGVNGFFLSNLMRTGLFNYDPSNYHGPTLYYFTLPLATLAERFHLFDTWTVRLLPLIFGLATVWLTFSLHRYIGQFGALAAAALLALSPGVVFFSRYFIHEMMFVFFTLGMVIAALRFYEEEQRELVFRNRWLELLILLAALPSIVQYAAAVLSYLSVPESILVFSLPRYLIILSGVAVVALLVVYEGARAIYLGLASLSAALLFATKETAFISVGVLLIAWGSACFWVWLCARTGWSRPAFEPKLKRARDRSASQPVETDAPRLLRLVERFGGWPRLLVLLIAAAGIFLCVNILFYSSFFTNPKGITDSLKAFDIWTKTGKSGFHGYGWHKYLQWLLIDKTGAGSGEKWEFGEEPMLLLLASLGALLALWKTRRRFPLFAALWGFGLLAAYSIIKYKTPWLVLSMLVPFAITGGYALDWLYRRRKLRPLAFALLGFSLAVAAYQTYQLNFVHYDNDRYIYVYAHTKREYLDLINGINSLAGRAGTKFETRINVAAPEYWPMPWYLREYKHVGYQGRIVPTTTDPVIIGSTTQSAEMQAAFGATHRLVGTYPMRPGVTLLLYARRDLADAP